MEFQMMERGRIQPSPLNPRRHFDQEKLQELAGTMANGVGIIEPLVVRPRPDLNCYELIAGERRWRAAEIAGLADVPVVVKEIDDERVLEIMVIENNQREDVSPLDEADGFRRLLEMKARGRGDGRWSVGDVEELAERLGRSKKYVYDRIKLFDMVPAAQDLLAVGRITAGHAILLARLKPADQERAIDPGEEALFQHEHTLRDDDFDEEDDATIEQHAYGDLKARSVREFEAWIARHVRFDVRQAAEAAPLEYGEVASVVERAHARPGRGKKVVSITHEHVAPMDTKSDTERTYGYTSWRRADGQRGSERCDLSVLGVVVAGPRYGEAFDVCVNRDKCEVHWKQEIRDREKARKARVADGVKGGAPAAKSEDSWEARQRREREAEERDKKTWVAAAPAMVQACVAKLRTLKLAAVLQLILDADGVDRTFQAAAMKHLGGKSDADTLIRSLALGSLLMDIDGGNYSWGRETFQKLASRELGIDIVPMLKAVQTSAPKKSEPSKPKKAAVKKKAVAVAKDLKKKGKAS